MAADGRSFVLPLPDTLPGAAERTVPIIHKNTIKKQALYRTYFRSRLAL